jgi:hypothetical protein
MANYNVFALVYNSGTGKWEEHGGGEPVTFNLSKGAASPIRYVTRMVARVGDATGYDYTPLASAVFNGTGTAVVDITTPTITANLISDDNGLGGITYSDYTLAATLITGKNSVNSGTTGGYTLTPQNSGTTKILTITAVTRDQTQIEIAYDTDPNGSHHWVTRAWDSNPALPDGSYDFPANTPLWDLPIAYVRHIKVLDTIDAPTGTGTINLPATGTIEGYENITDWYNGPISTSNAWITTSTSTKALFNQDGSAVVGTNATLLFINITSGHTPITDVTTYTLAVNPEGPTGLANKTKDVTITARTPVTITQDYLRPVDNNSLYSFAPSLVGGVSAGRWSDNGTLPAGFSITADQGIIVDDPATRATRTLSYGNTNSTVTLTYNTNTVQNYLPNTTSKTFTNGFRRYGLIYITNPTSTTMVTGVVGQQYSDTNGIYGYGDYIPGDLYSYYTAHKPTNWNGTPLPNQNVFNSTASSLTGIIVTSPNIFSSGDLATEVDVIFTNDANGNPIPLPSQDTSPFHVRRTFTIPIGAPAKTFKVGPADPMSIITRAAIGSGEYETLIGFQVIEENGFTDPNSRYIVTNPSYLGSPANGLFDDSTPAAGGYVKFDYVWIPVKASAANLTDHYVKFTRENTSVFVKVTINNSVDTGTTAQISNVTYSGYSDPTPGTVHDVTYPFYQKSIGNGNYPQDVSQTFSVTVKSSAPHIVPPAGFFKLSAASGSADDLYAISTLIGIYDGNGNTNSYNLIQGNTCTVKFKSGVTASNPVIADNFNGTAYLDFSTYADGGATGLRRVVITVKKSRAQLTVTPSTISPQPVVGVAVSQQFTVGGGPTAPVTYSLSGNGLSYFTSYNISSSGLFTGIPNAQTPAYSFNIDVKDSSSPNKTGVAVVTGSINAAALDPSISNVTPSTWQAGSTQSIIIDGSNFGASNRVQIYQPGVLNTDTTLSITAQSASQITATYTAGTNYFTGSGNIGVTRLSDNKLATAAITIQSTATTRITSVDTPTTTAAGSNVSLTIRGTGFTSSGFIGYKASGASTWTEYGITATPDGTAATSTGTIPLGQAGTATVYYIQSNHVAGQGSVSLVVTQAAITTVTLTDIDSPYTQYPGSSTQGTPTNVSVSRNVTRQFQLSTNVVGATYSLNGTTLPLGYSLNGSTGVISGAATDSSVTSSFTIVATSGVNSKTVYYTFTVTGGVLTLSAQTFTVHVGETGVNKKIAYTGGTGTVSFLMQSGSGALPTNLVLNTDGTITGNVTATLLKDYTFIAVATDQASVSKTATITVTLAAAYTSPLISTITPAVGALGGGTQVTLTVSDIHPSFVVNVGGKVASIVSQALSNFAGTIVISTPAGDALGAVNVTITNTDGRVSPAVIFTYSNIVAPEFTALSPLPYGPFAGNQQLVLTGQNFADGMTVTFGPNNYGTGWAIDNVEVLSPTLAHVKTPAYAGAAAQTIKQTVDLTLANGGETKVVTGGYNYMPPPTIAAVIPPTGPSAGGTTIYITGANFFETNGLKPRVFIGAVEIPADRITLK